MFEYAKYGRYWKCVDFGNYYLLEFVIINDNFIAECFEIFIKISRDIFFN